MHVLESYFRSSRLTMIPYNPGIVHSLRASGLLPWHWVNHTIAPVPVKQPRKNVQEFVQADNKENIKAHHFRSLVRAGNPPVTALDFPHKGLQWAKCFHAMGSPGSKDSWYSHGDTPVFNVVVVLCTCKASPLDRIWFIIQYCLGFILLQK